MFHVEHLRWTLTSHFLCTAYARMTCASRIRPDSLFHVEQFKVRSRCKRTTAIVPRGTFGDSRGWRVHCSTWNNPPSSTPSCECSTGTSARELGSRFYLVASYVNSARVVELARRAIVPRGTFGGFAPWSSLFHVEHLGMGAERCHCSTWNNPGGESPRPSPGRCSTWNISWIASEGVAIVPRGTIRGGGGSPKHPPGRCSTWNISP
jgi:hypothetical protein